MAYIRDDPVEKYLDDIIEAFIHTSQEIQHDLRLIDEGMGEPEASLHTLEAGLIIQFHFPTEDAIFFSMERDVGRDFTRFMDECRNQTPQASD